MGRGPHEATHAGELVAASVVVNEVYQQCNDAGEFSNDMLIRMALAQHDVRRLTERFRYLIEAYDIDDINDVQRARTSTPTVPCWHRSSTANRLPACVDIQENPKSLPTSVEQLMMKIRSGVAFWAQLVRRSGQSAMRSANARRNSMT